MHPHIRPFGISVAAFTSMVAGQLLAAPQLNSTPLPGDLQAAPATRNQDDPFVVAGPGHYFAVYQDERVTAASTVGNDPWGVVQTDIYATRISPDGAVIDAAPIIVDSSAYSQLNPSAAFNGTHYLVAFESRGVIALGTGTSRDLRAVRVSPDGDVLDAEPIAIDISDDASFAPTVGSDGTNWVVLYSDGFDLFAVIVDPDGNVGPQLTLATAVYTYDVAVAYAQGRFLVCWEGGIKGRIYDTSMNPLTPQFSLSNWADDADPAVATDGTSFYVAWTYLDSYHPEVRGSEVLLDGTVVTPGGVGLDNLSEDAWSGPGLAWNGSHYVVSWLERRYDFTIGDGVRKVMFNHIDSAGNSLGAGPTHVLETSDFDPWRVRVASLGQGTSFLSWTDARHGTKRYFGGFGTVLDSSGGFAPESPFTVAPPAQLTPDLALGPQGDSVAEDVNLATFVSTDATETRVVFQRLDGLGAPIDPVPIILAAGKDTYENTAVAWNGSLWLVVWEDVQVGFPSGHVLGVRVLPDGTVLDTTPFFILFGSDPDVAALGDTFLVVSSESPIHEVRRIQGMRVRGSDGALLDASQLYIGNNYALAPCVEAFADRWLVAWNRHSTHDSPSTTLKAAFVLASGTVQPDFSPGNFNLRENSADLAIVGDVATLVWSDRDKIRMRQILSDGTLLGPAGGIAVTAGEDETTPTIAWDGSNFVLSSVDRRIQFFLEPELGDLIGTRLAPDLTVLDPQGVVLAADPAQAESEAAIRGRNGRSIVVYPAILGSFGNWRVSVGLWSSEATATNYCSTTPNTADPLGGVMGWSGSLHVSDNALQLAAGPVPNSIGLFYFGAAVQNTPFGDGVRCVGGGINRLKPPALPALPNMAQRTLDFTDPTGNESIITGGDTWYFQYWFRDTNAMGASFNLSDGLRITFGN